MLNILSNLSILLKTEIVLNIQAKRLHIFIVTLIKTYWLKKTIKHVYMYYIYNSLQDFWLSMLHWPYTLSTQGADHLDSCFLNSFDQVQKELITFKQAKILLLFTFKVK